MIAELLRPDIEILIQEKNYGDVAEFLESCHPAESAELLTDSEISADEIKEILLCIEEKLSAEIFCELSDALQFDVAQVMTAQQITKLMKNMPPDERADLAKELPEEQLEEVMPLLAQKERDDLKKLVAWQEGTVGSVMTTDYIAFSENITVRQAIEQIRLEGAQKAAVSTIFTLDTSRHLTGFLTLEDLILAKPFATLDEAKNDTIAEVMAAADREEAVYNISKYNLMTLPVVDENRALIGVITHDDIIDIIEEERTEDMERFMAISGKHEDTAYLQTSVLTQFRRRVFWLVGLAFCGLISGAVLQSFEATIANLMLLTFYMPMLADTGGNTGSQSATVVIRALALKEIEPLDALRVVWKEFRIALLLGLVLGTLAFLRVELMSRGAVLPDGMSLFRVAFVIGTALCAQVVSATVIGSLLPMVASALKMDPALVASPALTTIVDITGLLIYFGLATVLLRL